MCAHDLRDADQLDQVSRQILLPVDAVQAMGEQLSDLETFISPGRLQGQQLQLQLVDRIDLMRLLLGSRLLRNLKLHVQLLGRLWRFCGAALELDAT